MYLVFLVFQLIKVNAISVKQSVNKKNSNSESFVFKYIFTLLILRGENNLDYVCSGI